MSRPAGGGPAAPQDRVARYRVGPGTLASLLAGRASYRLVLLATTVALLPVWGEERYGTFAAAMAAFSWLTALVFTGPEKALLKLLPRSPRIGPDVIAGLVAVLWWLPLPLASAFVLVWAGGASTAAVYVGVATMHLSVGCTMLLVGLHRATGRPRADSATFLTMSVAQVLLLGGAVAGHVLPVGYVAAVVLLQLGLNVALSVALGRPSLRIRRRPRFVGRLVVTALLLSGTDQFLYLSTAVVFLLLQGTGHAGQVGRLYVASLVVSVAVNLMLYVLRVFAPRTSLLLAGRSAAVGRARAARLAAVVTGVQAAWLVAAGLAVWLAGIAAMTEPVPQMVVWAVLLATGAPGLALLLWANYLLENTDATAPRVVAAAAVAGLLTVVVSGVLLIPPFGGVGVIIATTGGQVAYAAVLAAVGRPSAGSGSGRGRSTLVPWWGQAATATRSAPAGTKSSSTGRRSAGSDSVNSPSRSRG